MEDAAFDQEAVHHLQGKLEVTVIEARNLSNPDQAAKRRPGNLSDPYVVVKLIGPKKKETKLGKTHTIDDCLNPKWSYNICTDVNQDVAELRFDVKNDDRYTAEKIGWCSIPVMAFTCSSGHEVCLDLLNKKEQQIGMLVVKIKFSGNCGKPEKHVPTHTIKQKGCVFVNRSNVIPCNSEAETSFIHGTLTINIKSAENLPNMDSTFFKEGNRSDHVTASLVDAVGQSWKVATTHCISDDLNPVWGETFSINVCHEVTSIIFAVYDQDLFRSETIGKLVIPWTAMNGNYIEGRFDLKLNQKNRGRLNVSIRFDDKNIQKQETPSSMYEVPNTIYSLRSGNKVKLYQDAHCPKLPSFIFSNSKTLYVPQNAWVDVQDALLNAENLILIIGWSVKTSIALVRGEYGGGETLGQILSRKAHQGVDVRLLLWDEITSTAFNPVGGMETFDNETKEYFQNSPVKVLLALRQKNNSFQRCDNDSLAKCCYSHHQKTIITDGKLSGRHRFCSRRLVAFLGGLDLTVGRYDTPDHPLFSTLAFEHKNDFYNKIVNTTSRSGPREPWHDIHCQIIGPATRDLLNNFIERWTKQGSAENISSLNTDEINLNYKYKDIDCWDVQIFRSISEDSFSFNSIESENIFAKQGTKVDNSLYRAYIHQIQNSQKFIYMENQYFMGSSHFWEACRDITITNLIPLEIVSKITDKIKKGEPFVAYIVIPMFPEGNPEDAVIQELVHWEFHTIEMMYNRIGKAIEEKGINANPQDYLMFFCLGNREGSDCVPCYLKEPLDEKAALAFKNRRSMIYVHSKMAIFDDEYILVGSANINDRSLVGTRDTEIAMGAYQPAIGSHGNGDVSTFRKSLWLEHLGASAPLHLDPGSQHCARTVRQMAEEALSRYIDVSKPLPESHLLLYPLKIGNNGVVSSRADCETFPDTKTSVLGMRSKVLPSTLTT